MQNRRDFIKKTLAGTAFAAMPFLLKSCTNRNDVRLVILHTNDVHSHIEPMPENHGRFPGQGGFARRATIVNQIRQENEQVLLLDSGDIFQGTPYFNFYEGSLELKLMSKMGYDAATLGNHEFDNGIESLSNQLRHANFPFIATNYDVSATLLEGKIKPWHIIQKGALRIGIIGLGIDPAGLIAPPHVEGLKWLDPVITGGQTAELLKSLHRCDIVIALSHLGIDMGENNMDDLKLAAQTHHIDLILGGHTHRFMDQPLFVSNLSGKEVLIWQSGQNGVQMGRLDLVFSKGKDPKVKQAGIIRISGS